MTNRNNKVLSRKRRRKFDRQWIKQAGEALRDYVKANPQVVEPFTDEDWKRLEEEAMGLSKNQ